MQNKRKDYSKKATGQHKVRGPGKNRKAGVNVRPGPMPMSPTGGAGNRADQDLGKLIGG